MTRAELLVRDLSLSVERQERGRDILEMFVEASELCGGRYYTDEDLVIKTHNEYVIEEVL